MSVSGVGPKLQNAIRRNGVIVRASEVGVAIAPILTINESQCDEMAGAIADALDEVLG